MRGQPGTGSSAHPLRGRDADLAAIRAILARSDSGGPVRGVVVEGDAGVGKTRLALEVATIWTESGGHHLRITPNGSNHTFDLGPFAGLAAELDPTELDAAAVRVRRALLHQPHLLLVVDGVEHLDRASASLITDLVLAEGAPSLIATVRSGAEWPAAIELLAHDGTVAVHELEPLGKDELAEAIADRLGGPAGPALVDEVARLCGSDLTILDEVIELGARDGVIAHRVGQWTVAGTLPIGRRAVARVRGRLQGLSQGSLRALDVLAVAHTVSLEAFVESVGEAAAEEADGSGFLLVRRVDGAKRVEFMRPVDGEVIERTMGDVRRMHAQATLQKTLVERNSVDSADRLALASCLLETGATAPGTPDLLTEASRLARPDHRRAEQFARAALDSGGGFDAADYLIDALLWQGNVDAAQEVADGLTDLTEAQRSYLELRMVRMVRWISGAGPSLTPEGGNGSANGEMRVADAARVAAMDAAAGLGAAALEGARAVLDSPEADDEAVCWATGAALIVVGGQGHVDDALVLLDRAYRATRRLTDFNYRLLLSVLDARARRLSGDLTGARQVVEDLARAAVGSRANLGLVELAVAEVALAQGRFDEVVTLLRQATAALDSVDFGGLSGVAHFRLAHVLAMRGDTARCETEIQLGSECEPRTLPVFRPELLLAKARALWASGHGKAARSVLADAERVSEESDQPLVTVHIGLTRLLSWRVGADLLSSAASSVDGSFSAAASSVARGASSGNLGLVVAGGEQFEELGARLEAAEVFAYAAAMARRARRPDEERTLTGRVHALTDQMGGVETPILRQVLPSTPLTRRQRDVALLVAQGLSNRQVADRLGVGVRTVESHLEGAFRRLGLSGRGELTTWFADERWSNL